ncbi:adenosine/AMP deaminase family protein [Rhizodiscina lignyota]|uniref:Adenosine/AMP deaminase family protein n=1 Tax=Rhizodiscina lignyota TaxID=1504668 RepID=A0A9P4MAS3_9PEZI|nr:adenosine/AMP deaminase family protein [Rhizodiscina lignyota]
MGSHIKSQSSVDSNFTRHLPKVELHAHLTGSISPQTLHDIWLERKGQDPSMELDDPLKVMSTEKEHFNVFTFFPLFDTYIYNLITSVSSIRQSTLAVLQSFYADGVRYLELRTTPRAVPGTSISKQIYISTVLDCMDEFFQSSGNDMSIYLILSIDRKNAAEEAAQTVDLAIEFRNQGRPVVGVDLCGNPARGDVSTFRVAFAKAKDAGLKITLHFAEIPASSTEDELRALLSYQPDRLGHVIHVPPKFKEEIVEKKLGLELCLSCNVLAKLTEGGFAEHHFGEWQKTGCPIALGTDDVGVFGSSLSNEYLLAGQHFSLTKADLLGLSRSAIECMFGGNEEKDKMYKLLNDFQELKSASP